MLNYQRVAMVKSSYLMVQSRFPDDFPMVFPMGFQPFPQKNPQTKWLDLHDLSVGPAILAIRWWLAEAP